MMEFNGYNDLEQQTLDITKKLTSIRRTNMALNYGTFEPLMVTEHVYVYARVHLGNAVVVVFNNSATSKQITALLPKRLINNQFTSHFKSEHSNTNGVIEVTLPAYSFEVFTSK
jgi:hypothetical protein